MKWTQAADDMLTRLWAERMSQGEIAKAIMAVHGGEIKASAIAGRKRKLAEQGIKFASRANPFTKKAKAKALKQHVIRQPDHVEHHDGVDYTALGFDGCRAILDKRGGDGLSMCCGRQRHNGGSYCADHTARYLNPNYTKGK